MRKIIMTNTTVNINWNSLINNQTIILKEDGKEFVFTKIDRNTFKLEVIDDITGW